MPLPTLLDDNNEVFLPFLVPGMNPGNFMPVAGRLLLGGWSFEELSTSISARIELRDGGPAGQVIVTIGLSPSQTVRDIAPGRGILIQSGLYVNVTSGTIQGTVWVGAA